MFVLARELGCTVGRLLEDLADGELEYWFALYKEEPFGTDWQRTGLLCATVANFNPWGVKRALKPDEFIPQVRKPITPEQARKAFKAAMAALGVKIIKKPK